MAKKPQTLAEAADYYSKAQDDLQIATATFFEKIALYSGAVISLSITFLGYLLSQDPSVFLRSVLGLPLYLLIFFAWGLLVLSLLSGLFIRVFSTTHLSRQMHRQWLHLFIKKREDGVVLKLKGTGEGWLIDNLDTDAVEAKMIGAGNVPDTYRRSEEKSARTLVVYDFVSRFIRKITVAFFVLGLVFTLVFIAISILTLANVAS